MEAFQAIAALLDMGYKAGEAAPLCGHDIEEVWMRHPNGHAVSVEHMKYPPDAYRQLNPTWAAIFRHNANAVTEATNHAAQPVTPA